MTGDKLSILLCNKGFDCVVDAESSSDSPAKAAATTLLRSGNISLVIMSDFNVPSCGKNQIR